MAESGDPSDRGREQELARRLVETATDIVRVADDGPGIPDNQKSAIFGKGEKGLDSQGTGLGLYLVKTLVENYDREVRVEDRTSDGEGRDWSSFDDGAGGAVFVVEFPTVEAE